MSIWIFSNQSVYEEVKNGVRLPCPDKCPLPLYQLMLKCWENDSSIRPAFISIIKQIEEIALNLPIPNLFTQQIEPTKAQHQTGPYQYVQAAQVARESQLNLLSQQDQIIQVPPKHDYTGFTELEHPDITTDRESEIN